MMKGTVYGGGVEMSGGMRQKYELICYEGAAHIRVIHSQDGVGKQWFISDCDSSCEQFICDIPEEIRPDLEQYAKSCALRKRGTALFGHHKRIIRG